MKKLFLSIVTVVSISISLRLVKAQEVTLTESIQSDGTRLETIHLAPIPLRVLKSKETCRPLLETEYYVEDPLISPAISLLLGEKITIIMDGGSLYESFFFDPSKNNLSILTPTRGYSFSGRKEPWLVNTYH